MIGRFVSRLIDAQAGWARPLGDLNIRVLKALFRPLGQVKDFLNGKWLGHSLHAALTDVPIGVFTLALIFDSLDLRGPADVAIAFGLLAMTAAAIAGLADYTDTDDRPRMVATLHATLMSVALVVYAVSFALRLDDGGADRLVPILLSVVGYVVITAGAWVGGEVVYALGNMVNRHAWRFGDKTEWLKINVTAVPEGVLTKAKAGTHSVVLVRQGESILCMHDICAHAGGPLSAGRIVDGSVECPWHFSRYDLATGRRTRGPTTFDQPIYEVRAAEAGGWEARRITGMSGQNP